MSKHAYDPDKFHLVQQVGGIRTATFDQPDAGGAPACRVAMVDTGAGLRFTVALDRGGDIVEAHHHDTSLTFLTPNGYAAPSHAYHRESDWLRSWPGGLVTSCGPQYIGSPRIENDEAVTLHGHHSNTPAALLSITNPDPRRGQHEMALEMVIQDAQMFGPVVEVRRAIHCTLGEPTITIEDHLTNLGNDVVPHNWLYHVNFGYPLLDEGTRLVYSGKLDAAWPDDVAQMTAEAMDAAKTAPAPAVDKRGRQDRGFIVEPTVQQDGLAHVGILNRQRGIGMEMRFSPEALPRMTNWQHYSAAGFYVTALEPFAGSLHGTAVDKHPKAAQWLEPGEARSYTLTLRAIAGQAGLDALLAKDGDVVV